MGGRRIRTATPGGDISIAPPDPFEDIMAPPLRIVTSAGVAPRRIESDNGVLPGVEPIRALDNVILLRNPLRTAPQRAEPGPDAEDLSNAAALDIEEEPASLLKFRMPLATPLTEPVASDPRSGHDQLRFGVVVGLILAVGIVALAILFRPTPAAATERPGTRLEQPRYPAIDTAGAYLTP